MTAPTTDLMWEPTRAEGLRRLDDFAPASGRHYGEHRNSDLGPDDRTNVSTLSPYIRHRLVAEPEVAAAAIREHGPRGAERFLQEVGWRTYWKGWLELRPSAWQLYKEEVRRDLGRLDADATRDLLAATPAVDCLVEAGGAVVMRPLLLHSSRPADEPARRRVVHLEYAAAPLPGGLEWFEAVGRPEVVSRCRGGGGPAACGRARGFR